MQKNKTALQMLIEWGDKMLKDNPNKLLSFAEVIDKAEELLPVEKEQIMEAYSADIYPCSDEDALQYYLDTYEKE